MSLAIFDTPSRPMIELEIARTPLEWQHGLMFRRSLPPQVGMLFIYPRPAHLTAWMKNTYLSLDIFFIDQEFRIVDVHESAVPLSTRTIHSRAVAKYMLETNAGFARRYGVSPGTRVRFVS